MALPHHLKMLDSPSLQSLMYDSVKGMMKSVKGNMWQYNLNLPTITWNAPRPIDEKRKLDIIKQLGVDQNSDLIDSNPYTFGKQASKNRSIGINSR